MGGRCPAPVEPPGAPSPRLGPRAAASPRSPGTAAPVGSGIRTPAPRANDRAAAGDSAWDSAWPRLGPHFLPRCGLRPPRGRKGGRALRDPPPAGKGQERGGARKECAEAPIYPRAGRLPSPAPGHPNPGAPGARVPPPREAAGGHGAGQVHALSPAELSDRPGRRELLPYRLPALGRQSPPCPPWPGGFPE